MAVAIASAAIVLMIVSALFADRRLRKHRQIPMQWGFDGNVNWMAPRRIGLAFIPTLTILLLVLVLFHCQIGLPMNTNEQSGVIAISLTCATAQLLHLSLVSRTIRS